MLTKILFGVAFCGLCLGARADDPVSVAAPTRQAVEYRELNRLIGYSNTKGFVHFLESVQNGEVEPTYDFETYSVGWILLLVLGGGFLLNLSPCVLPMIPVNLAIIGAGAQSSSRRRGFLLGGVYGLGIALAYGALGIVSLLTGTVFGTVQSSVIFQGTMALLFLVLALAMFGAVHIDFSRFGGRLFLPRGDSKLVFGSVFGMGAVSAVLAGACVAPILVSTLLYATQLYAQGHWAGLLLPFALGMGMALPWPFAGAGLSFLPKPGAWMKGVKIVLGCLILFLAFDYGRDVFRTLAERKAQTPEPVADGWAWEKDLRDMLGRGQPVVLDFGAAWCLACVAMEDTLKSPEVQEKLQGFSFLKINCTNMEHPETTSILRQFNVQGFPTFVIVGPGAPDNF